MKKGEKVPPLTTEVPDKPIEQYTDEEVKQMFVDLFFWVADNRPDWLAECISIKKAQLAEAKMK